VHILLISLVGFLGLSALFGGGALILSPSGKLLGLPLYLIEDTWFHSFLIPGLILFIVLGVIPTLIAFALNGKIKSTLGERLNMYKDMHWSWTFSIYISFTLILWIQAQTMILQAVGWLHLFYVVLALTIILTSLFPQVRNMYKK